MPLTLLPLPSLPLPPPLLLLLLLPAEMVGLVREPENAYDANAIRVENIAAEKVGHLNRQLAAQVSQQTHWVGSGMLVVLGGCGCGHLHLAPFAGSTTGSLHCAPTAGRNFSAVF